MKLSFLNSKLAKNISFVLAVLLLLPSLMACGFKKQEVIYKNFSTEDSASGWLDQDDILQALVKIELTTADGYYPVKAALIIKKPSYLRLELIPVIGTPDFLLVSTPEKMSIFIPSKGELYSGLPTDTNLKKFLSWPIEIEEMVMIFTGTLPPLKEKNVSYQGFQEGDLWRMEIKAPSGCSQTVWMQEKNKLFKMIRKNKRGENIYTVKYAYDYSESVVPVKITINMADGTTSLSIKYSDVKIEKSVDLSVFNLVIPADVKEIPLE